MLHVLYAYKGVRFGLREPQKPLKGKCWLCVRPVFRSVPLDAMASNNQKWLTSYPKNVGVIRWFNQTINQPGADLVDTDCEVKTLPYKHSEIDDSPEYHEAALREAYFFVNGN